MIFGVFTIIGGITAFGRIFDAFTDPMIASWSDRCTSKNGRRIPFLKGAALPLALSTVLVFWSPANENSWINAAFLFVMILAYYLSITAYCTPYNALIPELGHTQQERLNISTIISFTFIAGTAVAYLAPTIWGALIPSFGRVNAIRVTFTAMALAAFVCMLVPVFCIREKDYVDTFLRRIPPSVPLRQPFETENSENSWDPISFNGSHLPCSRRAFRFSLPAC